MEQLLSNLFVKLLYDCKEDGFVEIQGSKYQILRIDGCVSLTPEEATVLANLGVYVCDRH